MRDGEPQRAFAAFVHYRDLAPHERSLSLAYSISTGKPDAQLRAPGHWAAWSSEWEWVARAAAYDAWLDGERRRVREARTRELAERRADVEFRNQGELERWAEDLDTKLREVIATGFEEIEREYSRDSNGELVVVKEKKRTKFPAFGAIARLLRERNETARQAIEGPQLRPAAATPDQAKGDAAAPAGEASKFEWVKPAEEAPPSDGEQ